MASEINPCLISSGHNICPVSRVVRGTGRVSWHWHDLILLLPSYIFFSVLSMYCFARFGPLPQEIIYFWSDYVNLCSKIRSCICKMETVTLHDKSIFITLLMSSTYDIKHSWFTPELFLWWSIQFLKLLFLRITMTAVFSVQEAAALFKNGGSH